MPILMDEFDDEAFVSCIAAGEKNDGAATSTYKVPEGLAEFKSDKDHPNGYAVVRLINGAPKTPTDPGKPNTGKAKLVNISYPKDESGKAHRIILPAYIQYKPQFPSVFEDFISTVLGKHKVKNADGTESWVPTYEDRHDYGAQQTGRLTLADIYNKVKTCDQPVSPQGYKPKSWFGSTVYIANCIDRTDMAWHRAHKSSKILYKTVTKSGDNIKTKEIPWYCFQTGLEEVRASFDNTPYKKLQCDLYIGIGALAKDPYKFENASKRKSVNFLEDLKLPASVVEAINPEPGFTEEEQSWNTIDIEEFYAFTPTAKLLEYYGSIIQMFDSYEGTNFYARMQEESAWESKSASIPETVVAPPAGATVVASEPVIPIVAEPKVTVVTEPKVTPAATSEPKMAEPVQPSATASVQESLDDFYKTLGA